MIDNPGVYIGKIMQISLLQERISLLFSIHFSVLFTPPIDLGLDSLHHVDHCPQWMLHFVILFEMCYTDSLKYSLF